ncbi:MULTISPECIES: hypothetical protein [unclassified Sulfuricurvum]|uniref:hypothetical protein n=1 Tax=unclassified Sulfuricurvum TaxID=2632390 RepID=UPI000299829F|nr:MULTISPECIES: hypothetical protein [unclassified Sulfuricurvum]AFV96932.1 hypothetical protein B649_03090 [Candidatus Sulfuricurvum sp. RIFRC-1]HBM35083.1 hypothetical protein [Sulfuricurvum sp.]
MNKRAIDTDIVLIDIIDFSRLSMDEQLEIISYLSLTYKKMIEKMVKISGIPMEKMLQGIIPTGDGFYCILHPRLKGFGPILGLSFIHFSDFIAKEYPYFKGIRVAVHTGKVHRFEDILGHENFVGDGLNECSRYIEIKNLIISTVIISDRAYEILQEFLHLHNDFRKLLETCEFRHSSLHTFQDKHNITRNGYLIWMRKGAIIPPPQINLAPPAKKR